LIAVDNTLWLAGTGILARLGAVQNAAQLGAVKLVDVQKVTWFNSLLCH